MNKFSKVQNSIKYLLEDNTTPKTVREKLNNMITYLDDESLDDQRKISTVLSELEEMSSDVNLPPYVRTHLYSISSDLEAIGQEE